MREMIPPNKPKKKEKKKSLSRNKREREREKTVQSFAMVWHILTRDQGCFWKAHYQNTNENEFFDVFHAHQHFFLAHLHLFHLMSGGYI